MSILPAPRTTALLTLTRQPLPNYNIVGLTQHHLPMGDVPTRPQIAEAVKLVESHVVEGHRVWVHCQKGIDRTGCVVGACLARSGVPPDEVIAMLLERFPPNRRSPRMIEFWRPCAELIRSFAPPLEQARDSGISGIGTGMNTSHMFRRLTRSILARFGVLQD